ncbi:MAG: matrixin family metalloprotease, partial [Chitinophagaceae bacterium]
VYVGITMNDISTTKGDVFDYGVMGLGFMPGHACVASNFRLREKKNFFKVAIHELGHTTGLPHCPDKTCYMRDAEGGDHTNLEKGFCPDCKKHLVNCGWNL